jgi:hypothetical protein
MDKVGDYGTATCIETSPHLLEQWWVWTFYNFRIAEFWIPLVGGAVNE